VGPFLWQLFELAAVGPLTTLWALEILKKGAFAKIFDLFRSIPRFGFCQRFLLSINVWWGGTRLLPGNPMGWPTPNEGGLNPPPRIDIGIFMGFFTIDMGTGGLFILLHLLHVI